MNPSLRLWRLTWCLLVALLLGAQAVAQVDTIRACQGTSVELTGPAGQLFYAWSGVQAGRTQPSIRITATSAAGRLVTVRSRGTLGPNLIQNGDFEAGNQGFTTDYTYTPNGTLNQASYAILTDPSDFNLAFASCDDPSTPGGQMYVADGSTVVGDRVWCQQLTGLDPNSTYAFSVRISSIVTTNPAQLRFSINGVPIGPTVSADPQTCTWATYFSTLTTNGAGSAELCIVNANTVAQGNDFALDDLSFFAIGPERRDSFFVQTIFPTSDSILVPLCSGERYTELGLNLGQGETGVAQLTSSDGCDSLITVTTIANSVVTQTARADTLCPGEIFRYRGVDYTQDETICDTFMGANGCDSVFCLTIKFLDASALVADAVSPSCAGTANGSLSVDVQAGRPPFDYLWQDGSTRSRRDSLTAGTYTLTVTDRTGCQATASYPLTDPEQLLISELATFDVRCFGESNGLVFARTTGGAPPIRLSAKQNLDTFPLDMLAAGTYTLVAQDSLGCQTDSTFTISTPKPVRASVSGTLSLRIGEEGTYFVDADGDEVSLTIGFGADTLFVDTLLRRFTLPLPRTGFLRVSAIDVNGCQADAQLLVEVQRPEDLELFPTAFSPNGDGNNEVFSPVPDPAVERIEELAIYNRWGNQVRLISGCSPVADRECGWDGRHANGKLVDQGVYVYYAVLRLIDGTELTRTGEVTLVTYE